MTKPKQHGSRVQTEMRKTFGKDRWDQGLGTRVIGGWRVVPFLTEATCREWAGRAAGAGHEVSVRLVAGLWVYGLTTG